MKSESKEKENCTDCSFKISTTAQIKELEKENERLFKEQDFMFLALELFLEAVKLWGQQNGLIQTDENLNDNISNKVNLGFNQFEKEKDGITKDKVMTLLAILNGASV